MDMFYVHLCYEKYETHPLQFGNCRRINIINETRNLLFWQLQWCGKNGEFLSLKTVLPVSSGILIFVKKLHLLLFTIYQCCSTIVPEIIRKSFVPSLALIFAFLGAEMVIYGVYIVSKSGGLIFNHDQTVPRIETERVFNYPIDMKLEFETNRISVAFGQKDGINGEITFSILTALAPTHSFAHFQLDMCWLHWIASRWKDRRWRTADRQGKLSRIQRAIR